MIIISRAALDGFERALSCPERGSNTLLGSFPSLEGGGVARVKGVVSIGNVASRASAGAAPEGARKGRARGWGACCLLPPLFVLDGYRMGLQPGGRGAWLSFRPGGVCVCVSDPLFWWGRPLSPPSVQHRPRVTYSGTAKGPLLGGLPIVSGLEGVCDVEEKETEGLNPAACYTKRLERCEGTRKQSEAWG